jgi:hypothetical protein
MTTSSELAACTPQPLRADGFNSHAELPYGLAIEHLRASMSEFLDFLGFINVQLHTKQLAV